MWIFKRYPLFFLLLSFFFIVFCFPIIFIPKIKLLLWLNKWHHSILDFFFTKITILGEYICFFFMLFILFFFRIAKKKILIGLFSFVFTCIFVQILKHIIFVHHLRPMASISIEKFHHIVANIPLQSYYSFPSGHAATIFSCICFIIFACNIQQLLYQLLLIGIAFLVAYSRVYLVQHFYHDIYFGALIGVIITTYIYSFYFHFSFRVLKKLS